MPTQRLEAIAYRMLGSAHDAEEVVQEARLRLHLRATEPANEEAFLVRSVSNLCIDRLRRLQTERAAYAGPWLPEPLPADWQDGPAATAELAEELSLGFMLLLDQLAPQERAVFVLRQGYDLSHAEIAATLGITEANARQLLHRAQKALAAGRASAGHDARNHAAEVAEHRALIDRMLIAVASDDIDTLASLFSADAMALTDGGGVVSAARVPIEGAARIAQVTMHLAHKNTAAGDFDFRIVEIAGALSLVILQEGALHSLTQITTQHGAITRLYVLRNPHKLTRIQGWLEQQ